MKTYKTNYSVAVNWCKIRLQLAAACVRLVQTTAQITNCVAANLLARKCLICVITAKRQYHKTYWKVQR